MEERELRGIKGNEKGNCIEPERAEEELLKYTNEKTKKKRTERHTNKSEK